MRLETLLPWMEVVDTQGELPETVGGIAYDSRQVKEDDLFFALPGTLVDGRRFIKDAKSFGATVAVVEEFTEDDIPQIKVKNPRRALALSSSAIFHHPSKELFVIGITATNGKTSTAFLLESMFKKAGKSVGMIGTVKISYKDRIIPSILTTPESYDLQKVMKEMVESGVEVVIMEVSSSAQEMHRIDGTDFDVISFHNLSEEHIDQHGSFEAYVEAKSRIIREADSDTMVFLSVDDKNIGNLVSETRAEFRTLSFTGKNADVCLEGLRVKDGGGEIQLHFSEKFSSMSGNENITLPLASPGYATAMNATTAVAIALSSGVSLTSIAEALEEFRGVERRFQLIYDGAFRVLDDHFANPKNIDATMSSLHDLEYENLIIYYAIRGNRGVNLNREVAQQFSRWIKSLQPAFVIATKSAEDVGRKDEVSPEEESVFLEVMKSHGIAISVAETLQEGMEQVVARLGEGDLLLLAGCQGMDHGAQALLRCLKSHGAMCEDLERIVAERIC